MSKKHVMVSSKRFLDNPFRANIDWRDIVPLLLSLAS